MENNPFGNRPELFKEKYFSLFKEAVNKALQHQEYMDKYVGKDKISFEEQIRYSEYENKSPLKLFLDGLDAEDVKAVRALMYIGRDGVNGQRYINNPEKNLNDMIETIELGLDNSKEINIDMIMEKSPVYSYLRDGMTILFS